ncbi:hypothetical protein D3C72_1143580 [compost metagenome]
MIGDSGIPVCNFISIRDMNRVMAKPAIQDSLIPFSVTVYNQVEIFDWIINIE